MKFSCRIQYLYRTKDLYFLNDKDNTCDGMFGREWYANKIWLIDYRNQQMFAIESYSEEILSISATIPVSFRKTLREASPITSRSTGGYRWRYPVYASDTGAQTQLSDQATSAFNQSGTSSISFIDQSTFEKWEQHHPDWRVVKGGDTSLRVAEDIIEVPGVNIGDTVVGPVYFAKRADQNFVVMSNNFMDQQITGALEPTPCRSLVRSFWIIRNSDCLYRMNLNRTQSFFSN